MADQGIGFVFDTSSKMLVGVSGGAVATFILLFSVIACCQTNEVIIARRCIFWARLSIIPLFVCHAIQLNLDLKYFFSTIMLPSVSVVRPALGLVLCFLSFFVNSHAALRWFVVLTQPAFIVASLFTAASMRVLIDCRIAGSCLVQSGISLAELQMYENVQFTEAFFALWLVLVTSYLLIAMGVCTARYPVRLFAAGASLVSLANPRSVPSSTPSSSGNGGPSRSASRRGVDMAARLDDRGAVWVSRRASNPSTRSTRGLIAHE